MPLILAILICGMIFFPTVIIAFTVGTTIVLAVLIPICSITVITYAFCKTAKEHGIKQAWKELVDLWKGNVKND